MINSTKPSNLKGDELAKNIGNYYHVLKELYPDKEYTVGELATILKKKQSNTSRLVSRLDKLGLVKTWEKERPGRPYKHVKLLGPVRDVLKNLLEVANMEEIWHPQPSEIKLCLEVLEAGGTEETRKAFLSELESILNSDYWDNQLESFFGKALDNPERYWREIDKLLRAQQLLRPQLEDSEMGDFLKREKKKIYGLVRRSGNLRSFALRVFIDVSEGREALDRMEEDLKGEGAEIVLVATQDYGLKLYEKFGVDFKVFLHRALEHESEPVRKYAFELMNEISPSRRKPR